MKKGLLAAVSNVLRRVFGEPPECPMPQYWYPDNAHATRIYPRSSIGDVPCRLVVLVVENVVTLIDRKQKFDWAYWKLESVKAKAAFGWIRR